MKFNFFQIGYILRAKGLKGEVKVSFEAFFFDFLLQKIDEINPFSSEQALPQSIDISAVIDHLFVKNKDNHLPYFIEKATLYTNDETAVIKFEDLSDKEQATDLRSKPLFINLNTVPIDLSANEQEWDFLLGYEVISTDEQRLGRIKDIIYFPEHEVAQVLGKQTEKGEPPIEILVPLNEEYIELVDEESKILLVELPNGFLDLYI